MTLVSAGLEKKMNPKYNQNEFLDRFILKDISKAKILGDVVVVDGYGFEIDRSVPKIGKYVGKEEELVFPELRLDKEIREDSKTAVIKITTKEEKNGISKIEILQDGFVIETYEYSNVKEEITENYEVSRNGNYVVKVYSALSRTEMIEISELVANIKYSPNGSEEYKKEHTVQVSVDKTVDKVSSIKYQWTNTTEEPEESSFTESCTDGEKITKNEVTGSWYLWTLIETEGGKKRIEKSEAFKFDNEGPQVNSFMYKPITETTFSLDCNANDNETDITKYEFYENDVKVGEVDTSENMGNVVLEEVKGPATKYEVKVYDKFGNVTTSGITDNSNAYIFEKYELVEKKSMSWGAWSAKSSSKDWYPWCGVGDSLFESVEHGEGKTLKFKYPVSQSSEIYKGLGTTNVVHYSLYNGPFETTLTKWVWERKSTQYSSENSGYGYTQDRKCTVTVTPAPGAFIRFECYNSGVNLPVNGAQGGNYFKRVGKPLK